MDKPSPEYQHNPAGLTLRDLILAVLQSPDVATLLKCKVAVETSDDREDGEGDVIGRVIEFQWGRDGSVYMRIDGTQDSVRDIIDPH